MRMDCVPRFDGQVAWTDSPSSPLLAGTVTEYV